MQKSQHIQTGCLADFIDDEMREEAGRQASIYEMRRAAERADYDSKRKELF